MTYEQHLGRAAELEQWIALLWWASLCCLLMGGALLAVSRSVEGFVLLSFYLPIVVLRRSCARAWEEHVVDSVREHREGER